MAAERTSTAAALRGVRAAFVSFSRLPLGGYPYDPAEWRWAPAHLPLVGVVVGGISAAVWAACLLAGLSPLLAATLAVAASALATGALHEDGLADAADGLGGGHDPARVLAIMKDSRIGSYGALALGVSLLARVAAVASLSGTEWFVLPLTHGLARLGPVRLMLSERYVSAAESARSPHFLPIGVAQVAVATGWAAACGLVGVLAGCVDWHSLAWLPAVILLLTAASRRYFRRTVGGITGDLLGALEQATELALLVTYLCCRG
jgi:adenosylcobinamide-GDP ribazoletransferase